MFLLPILSKQAVDEETAICKANISRVVERVIEFKQDNPLLHDLILAHHLRMKQELLGYGLSEGLCIRVALELEVAIYDVLNCLDDQLIIDAQKKVQSKNKSLNN